MGKAKTATPTEPSRKSARLKTTARPATEAKKKVVAKRAPKAKKTKLAENGNTKPEEPKAEATEAK